MRNRVLFLIVVCLPVMLSGCPQLLKPPILDTKAQRILGTLALGNERLKRFKGLAKVQMKDEGRSQSGRIAFAAIQPDRLRVEMLNAMGGPITSLAGDGEHISIISHVDRKQYRIRQKPEALEPIIHLPVGLEDLLALLSGRVPLPSHAFAQMSAPEAGETMLILKNRWHGVVARLGFHPESHQVRQMDMYDVDGELRYRIVWEQWKQVGEFTLPGKVRMESSEPRSLTLWVDRFWPNTQVPPSTFVLDAADP